MSDNVDTLDTQSRMDFVRISIDTLSFILDRRIMKRSPWMNTTQIIDAIPEIRKWKNVDEVCCAYRKEEGDSVPTSQLSFALRAFIIFIYTNQCKESIEEYYNNPLSFEEGAFRYFNIIHKQIVNNSWRDEFLILRMRLEEELKRLEMEY